jgi:hypothetical protein
MLIAKGVAAVRSVADIDEQRAGNGDEEHPGDPEAATFARVEAMMRACELDLGALALGSGSRVVCYDFLDWLHALERIEVPDWS